MKKIYYKKNNCGGVITVENLCATSYSGGTSAVGVISRKRRRTRPPRTGRLSLFRALLCDFSCVMKTFVRPLQIAETSDGKSTAAVKNPVKPHRSPKQRLR